MFMGALMCRNKEIKLITQSKYFLHHLGTETSIEESRKNLIYSYLISHRTY